VHAKLDIYVFVIGMDMFFNSAAFMLSRATYIITTTFFGWYYQQVDRYEISIFQMAMDVFPFKYIFLSSSPTRLVPDLAMTNTACVL
jgi:hypothetical protein